MVGLRPAVLANFSRTSYCILATVREDPSNVDPLFRVYDGLNEVGNFSVIRGVVSHSLRGVTAQFTGNYSSNSFQRITVCVNAPTSEALLYVNCEDSPRERVTFIQRTPGVLGRMFVFGMLANGGVFRVRNEGNI